MFGWGRATLQSIGREELTWPISRPSSTDRMRDSGQRVPEATGGYLSDGRLDTPLGLRKRLRVVAPIRFAFRPQRFDFFIG